MSRSINRHYTSVWKKKRKHRKGDLCSKAKCIICHPHKVMGIKKHNDMKRDFEGL